MGAADTASKKLALSETAEWCGSNCGAACFALSYQWSTL